MNIFLALLFHSYDRTNYGNGSIFRCLFDEINVLQDHGITLNINGGKKTVYFALGLLIADNLELNFAMGYVECFRATHFCRLCKTKLKDTYYDRFEREDELRKKDEYESDLEKGMSGSGLKEKSVWNEIKYFHVLDDYYMDVFHDFHEGGLKYDKGHELFHFLFEVDQPITLEILNDRLRNFNYTVNNIKNKPPPITLDEAKNKYLSMCGSEM